MMKKTWVLLVMLMWLLACCTAQAAPAYVRVSSKSSVNLREQNNAESARIAMAKPGDVFVCLGQEKNGWYHIQLQDGRTAYISGKLAKAVQETPKAEQPQQIVPPTDAEQEESLRSTDTQQVKPNAGNKLTAKEIVSLVREAKEDITIELNQDVSFHGEKALANAYGAQVRIRGNGHSGGVMRFAEGSFVLEDMRANQVVVEPDETEICISIGRDCVINSNSATVMLTSEKPGIVRIDNAGTIIGVDAGVVFYSRKADLYLTNSGVIRASQALAIGDRGADEGRIFDICNTGELRGMVLAGADLVAGNKNTKISIYGGGMLCGSIGALIGGRGEILLDQQIVAKDYGTLYHQDQYPEYYGKFEEKLIMLDIAKLMAKEYILMIDEVNGQAVVDRGAKMRQYMMDGTVKPDTNPDDPENYAWHSPKLTVCGNVEAQRSVLGDLYLPRGAELLFESTLEGTSMYVRGMQVILQASQAFGPEDAAARMEDVRAAIQGITLGALEEHANVRVLYPAKGVYSGGTGEPLYAAMGGKLTDGVLEPMAYWEPHPLDAMESESYFSNMLAFLECVPQNSRIVLDRDLGFTHSSRWLVQPKASGIVLDGNGHRISHEQDFACGLTKAITIENFAQLNRLRVYGGEVTIKNTVLTDNLTLEADKSISGTDKIRVMLEGSCYDSGKNGHLTIRAKSGSAELIIAENAEVTDSWPVFTAEKGAKVSVINDGKIHADSKIRMEALGGTVSLMGGGSIEGGYGYSSVVMTGSKGGKAVFGASATEVIFDAENGEAFSAEIGGMVERVKLRMNAKTSASCNVKVTSDVSSLQLYLRDDTRKKEINDSNVKEYIKQKLSKVSFSDISHDKYLYVEIEYVGGMYSSIVAL